MQSSNQINNLSSCMNSQSRTLTICPACERQKPLITRFTNRLKEGSIQSSSFKHCLSAVNFSPYTDVFRKKWTQMWDVTVMSTKNTVYWNVTSYGTHIFTKSITSHHIPEGNILKSSTYKLLEHNRVWIFLFARHNAICQIITRVVTYCYLCWW
jgi:hypothetical protein